MFDMATIMELLKDEPGSRLAQCILLTLIWWNARGLKSELKELKETLSRIETGHSVRIGTLENEFKTIDHRLTLVEDRTK